MESGQSGELKRAIGLPFLILYGLGTMVGGGFYALLGKVAEESGYHSPLSFAFSGLLALLSAFSFAELSSRFPVSAGEARFAEEGFHNSVLASVVGWLVVLTGIVSAAALSVATIGFLQGFFAVHQQLGIIVLAIAMGAVAAWGIGQSVAVVTFVTIVEIGALIAVGVMAGDSLKELPDRWRDIALPSGGEIWAGIFAGGFLAFYAFIGFEDMVNIAEEVKDVRRAMPIAILVCVVLATALYVVVSAIAVLAVHPASLAKSNTPLAELVRDYGWFSTKGIGVVSVLTGLNGALVQIVMASRVVYGLAQKNQGPRWFGAVNSKTQTPIRATILITGFVLILALFFPLTILAQWTSAIILIVFAIVNLALWRIKGSDDRRREDEARFPRWLPMLGFLSCTSVLLFQAWRLIST